MIGDMKLELKKARENKYAIPAVNTINPLMMKQYIHIADELQVPLIVSLAEAHLKYMALSEAFQMYEYYAKQTNIPIILHLDHGQDLSIVKQAIDLGFPSVMIDASEYNFNTNVRLTKEITNYAKGKNVAVEAEIGHVGASDNYETDIYTESIYTSTQEAIDFVEQTQPDSLAISVGTVHGHYKGTPRINLKRIKEMRNSLDITLDLHDDYSSGDDNLK